MKRLNRILSLALAAMMALTLLTGCGGKVTERAMEKAYGDYLRGQMGKPDMKVTYNGSTELIWPATMRASISMFPGTPAPLEPALPCWKMR